MNSQNRPLLKYAGSKRCLAPLLADVLPAARMYVEPFVGSAAVWAAYVERNGKPNHAVLSDASEPLVSLLSNVVADPNGVLLGQNIYANMYAASDDDINRSVVYYMARTEYNGDTRMKRRKIGDGRPDGTGLFLNRTAFNGLYRVNRKGEFNVPFGKYKHPSFLDQDDVSHWQSILDGAEIVAADFSDILVQLDGDRDVTVYCDPPYLSTFSSYHLDGFSYADHVHLEALARRLTRGGASVVVSNSLAAAPLWDGWFRYVVKSRTSISRNANGRGSIEELLVTSFPIAPHVRDEHSIRGYTNV